MIAICTAAIAALIAYQIILGNEQVMSLKAELDLCETQIDLQKNELAEAEERFMAYEEELAQYEKQLADLTAIKEKEPTYAVSSTKEYAAWVAAQSALEPYDLYDDMKYAYDQFEKLNSDHLIGTEVYIAALNLLVPKKSQDDVSAYLGTLKRYFDVSDVYTIRSRFVDDLVTTKLIIRNENNSYSWFRDTLTTENVMSHLNLTEDVANAMLGILNARGWGI